MTSEYVDKPTQITSLRVPGDDAGDDNIRSHLEQLRKLVFQAPLALVIADADGLILELNHAAQKLIALPSDDIRGKSLMTLIHQDYQHGFTTLLEQADEEAIAAELVLRAGNGSSPWVELKLSKEEGLWVIWFKDISELKALGVQLKDQNFPSRKFLHDLGNALTAAEGYAHLMKLLLDGNAVVSGGTLSLLCKYHQKITQSLGRTQDLIADVKATQLKTKQGQKNKLMIVDDEGSIASLLSELMQQDNHEVRTFTDSEEALRYFNEHPASFDLVILDQFMPKLSGIQLATEILTRRKNLPIILCTGDTEIIDQQVDGDFNIKYFISKPIDIGDLLNMVRQILKDAPISPVTSISPAQPSIAPSEASPIPPT